MKQVSSRKVRKALMSLGLSKCRSGNGTGHEVWSDATGRRCHPAIRSHDISYAVLFSLGKELEAKGICSRRAFLSRFSVAAP